MNTDWAAIDASLVRAREGLRVLDEIARFVARDASLFEAVKHLRHQLGEWGEAFGEAALLSARGGPDAGVGPGAPELVRRSAWDLIRANAGRAGEGLRVLEEFAKLYAPLLPTAIKAARYRLYQLEAALARATPHFFLRRYFEQGVVYPLSESVAELQWLVEHGARVVQLRDKTSPRQVVAQKASELAAWVNERNRKFPADQALLIINDDAALAAALPVAGVHLGQSDVAVAAVRQILGSNKIIGRSNHSLAQLRASIAAGADYASLGPVFATPTKPERSAVGLDAVRQVAADVAFPWLAIGGINAENAGEVRAAGARNIAVVRSARDFFR